MLETYSVLIVDDEADIRELIESGLELSELTLKVFKAVDGADALAKITNQKFDLVITDLSMPRLDGKGFLEAIKNVPKENRPSNIIVASAHVEKEMLKDTPGGISIIKKPFSIDSLNKYVKVVLTSKKRKKKKAKPTSKGLNVEFVNPFIEATLEVLDVMANVKAEKDFLFLKENSEALGDITGIIPINSENEIGSFSITFTENVFNKVMSSMLGEEVTEIDEDNQDGVAELCNQIFGNAKAVLNKQNIFLDMTIPTVVCGHNHTVSHATSGSVVGVYFNTEFGTFVIECIVANK